jgi:RNA binding exosome subunit
MRTLALLVPFLVGGVIAAGYYGNKLRKIRVIENETQERAKNASENIREDLELKKHRDELRVNWDNEHRLFSDESFTGFEHTTQVIGGVIVSCHKCKEI